jgi:hypothetical protein
MNKITFLSGFILTCLLYGCYTAIISTELNEAVVNQSNKEIIYCIDTNIGNDCVTIMPQDSIVLKMEYQHEFSESILAYEVFPHYVTYNKILIYNLTDTTSMCDVEIGRFMKTDTVFASHFDTKMEGNSNDLRVHNRTVISNYVLSKFSKDYTMLERFDKYYQK